MSIKDIEPISDAEFGVALREVMVGLFGRAEVERRATEPWKDLFKASEDGLESLLSAAASQANIVIMSLADVIKTKFGIARVSPKLYGLLKALPFAMNELRDQIDEREGMTCCADKARYAYYLEVLAEIDRIKESQG